jgi:hypothetical protein
MQSEAQEKTQLVRVGQFEYQKVRVKDPVAYFMPPARSKLWTSANNQQGCRRRNDASRNKNSLLSPGGRILPKPENHWFTRKASTARDQKRSQGQQPKQEPQPPKMGAPLLQPSVGRSRLGQFGGVRGYNNTPCP